MITAPTKRLRQFSYFVVTAIFIICALRSAALADEDVFSYDWEVMVSCETFEKAVKLLEDGIEDPYFITLAAAGYLNDKCGVQDLKKGLHLLHVISGSRTIASAPLFHMFLGLAYLQGWGTEQNEEEARYWFQRFAIGTVFINRQSVRELFYNLSPLHGLTTPPNILSEELDKADILRNGSAEEFMKTYRALWTGKDLPLDQDSAIDFLYAAFERKLPEAIFELAQRTLNREIHRVVLNAHMKEIGIDDFRKLMSFLISNVADSGFGPAQKMLGISCWENGSDPFNTILAYVHLRRAFNGGMKEVEPMMTDVSKLLSERDLSLAADFIAENQLISGCLDD